MVHDGFEAGDFEQLETVEAAALPPVVYHPGVAPVIVAVID